MLQNMDKYMDEDNDYLVISAKQKIIANLLKDSDLSLSLKQIAKIANVNVDFVKKIQHKLAEGEKTNGL